MALNARQDERPRRPGATSVVPVLVALAACTASAPVDPVELAREEVAKMPGAAAGAYQVPSATDLMALSTAARGALTGGPGAGDAAEEVGYSLDKVQQAGLSGEEADLVPLRPGPRARAKGWGWALLRPQAAAPLLVEVPHPLADLDTELVGAEVFAATGATALLVAGAHRRAAEAADVAVEADSAFHAWQSAVVTHGDVVLQVHGFDTGAHPEVRADVVVSDGRERGDGSRPSDVSRRFATAFEDAGYDVCLHHRDRCDELAGTRNVQGVAARAAGAHFVHLELSRPLRSSPEARAAVAGVVAAAVGRASGSSPVATPGRP